MSAVAWPRMPWCCLRSATSAQKQPLTELLVGLLHWSKLKTSGLTLKNPTNIGTPSFMQSLQIKSCPSMFEGTLPSARQDSGSSIFHSFLAGRKGISVGCIHSRLGRRQWRQQGDGQESDRTATLSTPCNLLLMQPASPCVMDGVLLDGVLLKG